MKENHQRLLDMVSGYQHSVVDQVASILGSGNYSTEGTMSLSDELQTYRKMALERARMQADFDIKLAALQKVKEALANAPDLDIDKQFEEEVKKMEEEAPSDQDLENTDLVIREIDDKLSTNQK